MMQTANQIIQAQDALINKFGQDDYDKLMSAINRNILQVSARLDVDTTTAATVLLKDSKNKGDAVVSLAYIAWFGEDATTIKPFEENTHA